MTADSYTPATSLTGYYASRTSNRPARHWATEKLIHDLGAIGLVDFFEGPGPNPMALSDASTSKLWLDTEAGVTSESGTFKRYTGSGSSTDEANWIAVTPAGYLLHLGSLTGISTTENYATRIAAAAANISSGVTHLWTAGYSSVGDRGGGLYFKDVALREGGFQSADSAYWTPVADYNVIQFGADPTGTNDASGAIINALQKIIYDGGGKLLIPKGTYKISSSVQPGTIGCNIEVVFEQGAKLVAASGLSAPVLDLRAHGSSITDYTCRIIGPNIDASAGLYTVGAQSCTALSVQYFKKCLIFDPNLYGGEEPDNLNADSGITPIGNGMTVIEGGMIRGFADAAIYPTGDNNVGATGDGTTCIIKGVVISRCNCAVSPKRELNHLHFHDNYVVECAAGVVPSEVWTPSYIGPVRVMDIRGNTFRKVTANVARFRGPTIGSFQNNVVRDFGYTEWDGTGSAGANAVALYLMGSRGVKVSGNTFELVDWTRDAHVAVTSMNVTLDATLYTQGGNNFSDNSYRGVYYGLYEGSGGDASTYVDEVFDGVTAIVGGSFHSGSLLTYRDLATQRAWTRLNGVVQSADPGLFTTSTVDVTLTANDSGGTYRNDGATSLVTYTLPDAVAGLDFQFIVTDTDGIKIKAATGAVILSAISGVSTSGGSAQATASYAAIRLRAINTLSWIAIAQTGTWTMA